MAQQPPRSVIIVGGSLAGLMHALALLSLRNPPSVRILERSPTALLHNQGAGVVAGNETQEFLDKLVKPGRECAVTSHRRHYLDRRGNIMDGSVGERQQKMTSWDLLYHLLRWRVDGMQSEYVKGLHEDQRPKAKYDNGCTVTGIEDAGDKIKLNWTQKDVGEQSDQADLVIAADGGSSTIRRLLKPEVERKYVGYVAWRGTVPETELSASAAETLSEKFTFFHTDGLQMLAYLIAGENGVIERGKRLLNWVWYCNYAEGSHEFEELMTDVHGKRHALTLPVGTMNPAVWEKQKEFAKGVLPPQCAEVVAKTQQPFIQAITDNVSPENSFFGGKVLMVGDALAGFRPHTAASTSQAAFDALRIGDWLDGRISREKYHAKIMEYAQRMQKHGVELGERSQFGRHPLAG